MAMDELTFRVAYAAVGIGLPAVLLFLLSRRMERKAYLFPAVVGFLFALGTSLVLGGGIIAFLFAGVLTGYLVNIKLRLVSLFQAGGISGTLIMFALFVPGSIYNIGGGTFGLLTSPLGDIMNALSAVGQTVTAEQLLYELALYNALTTFLVVTITGMGAVLGSYLRKLLKPVEKVTDESKAA